MAIEYIGITASRKGLKPEQLAKLAEIIKNEAPDRIELHHGLCSGGDSQAHDLVVELYQPADRTIIGHPPVDQKHMTPKACNKTMPAKDYLVRNRDIVDRTRVLIACPNGPSKLRSGVWSTVRYCKKMGKPVIVVWPDGSVEERETELREANMTEAEKEVCLSMISKLFSNGVTEVYMREIMNAMKDKPEDKDLRLSNEWFEANGFSVEARTEFSRHPDYEIVRTYVRKAEAQGDGVDD